MKNLKKLLVFIPALLAAVLIVSSVAHARISNAPTSGTSLSAAGALLSANNLSDVANATTSRNGLFQNFGFTEIGSSTAVGASSTPTNALTFAAGSNGIAWYNTQDQLTNSEYFKCGWGVISTNEFDCDLGLSGSGGARAFSLRQGGSSKAQLSFTGSGTLGGLLSVSRSTSGSGYSIIGTGGAQNPPSGFVAGIAGNLTLTSTATSTAIAAAVFASSTANPFGTGENDLFRGDAAGVTKFVVGYSGFVGIGTSTPATDLHVVSASSTIRIGGNAAPGCLELLDSSGNSVVNYLTATGGVLSATTTKPVFCK